MTDAKEMMLSDYVRISRRPAMLKRVIENNHIDSLGDCFANSVYAVNRSYYRNVFIQSLVHDCLIAPIASKNYCWFAAFRGKRPREPRSNGCLAGAADGEIPNAQDRHRESSKTRRSHRGRSVANFGSISPLGRSH